MSINWYPWGIDLVVNSVRNYYYCEIKFNFIIIFKKIIYMYFSDIPLGIDLSFIRNLLEITDNLQKSLPRVGIEPRFLQFSVRCLYH